MSVAKSTHPITHAEVEAWGGLQPVYVHLSPNHAKEFCWDGDYSRLTINSPFKALVTKRLGWAASSIACDFKGYSLYACKHGACEAERVFLPMINSGCFHPWRSFKNSSRAQGQALTMLEWLHRNTPTTHVQFICLTAPGWVSNHLLETTSCITKNRRAWENRSVRVLARFEHAVSKFLANLHDAIFPRKQSKFGAIFVVHTWRSKHPLEKHLHAHLILPNVAYNSNETLTTSRNPDMVPGFYRFKPMLDHAVVKACWRDALVSTGLWDANDPSMPDVHLDYASIDPRHRRDRPRLAHHLRYIFRRPLADLNMHLEDADIQRLDLDEKFANFLLRYVPRRHRLGWLCNLKRFGFLCRKLAAPRCPVCGFEMSKLGSIRSSLPAMPHYFRSRSGEWSRIPPPFDALPDQTDGITQSPQAKLPPMGPGDGLRPDDKAVGCK